MKIYVKKDVKIPFIILLNIKILMLILTFFKKSRDCIIIENPPKLTIKADTADFIYIGDVLSARKFIPHVISREPAIIDFISCFPIGNNIDIKLDK